MRKILALFALTVLTAFAADVDGEWKGTMETPMGAMEITAKLVAEGEALNGTLNFMGNPMKIENGRLDGENISFELNMEFGTMSYSGSFSGDEMKLTVSVMDNEAPLLLKRAQSQ